MNNLGEFAKRLIIGRLEGFDKDIRICLAPFPAKDRTEPTHAYFPALTACCGLLEYLTAMHCGRIDSVGSKDVDQWSAVYLPQPDYSSYHIHVLVKAFRHYVAHRGIASGVWVDKLPGDGKGRRLTWTVHETNVRPAIRLVEERKTLTKDPPWDCPYTHRVHIHLRTLADDIMAGAKAFAEDVTTNTKLQKKFEACMNKLYPL